ncbi:MAG: hypothetical protein Q7T20_05890 [Saprospiraceae bacterium]|nr:hypothetical protein [Saprospiraceae bacterium]
MKTDKKRYLSHYFPEILRKKELPVNFEFTQFYTMDIRNEEDEDKRSIPLDEQFIDVKISAYQTDKFKVFSTLGKPISKIIR